ncbi:MAG: PKD domain-containing protein [Deinococcaceae bacterium]
METQAIPSEATVTVDGAPLLEGGYAEMTSLTTVKLKANFPDLADMNPTQKITWEVFPAGTGTLSKTESMDGEEITYTAPAGGSFPIFHVKPKVNPTDEVKTFLIVVKPNGTPIISEFFADPNEGYAPLNTILNFRIKDSDFPADKLTCELDYGDGSVDMVDPCIPDTSGMLGGSFKKYQMPHTYATPNTYTAKLTVKDKSGLPVISTTTIKVMKNPEAPVIRLGTFTATPNSGGTKLGVDFDFEVFDNDPADVLKCTLNFGDGKPDVSMYPCDQNVTHTITHIYDEGGKYNVILTVTDKMGHMTTERLVLNFSTKPEIKSFDITKKNLVLPTPPKGVTPKLTWSTVANVVDIDTPMTGLTCSFLVTQLGNEDRGGNIKADDFMLPLSGCLPTSLTLDKAVAGMQLAGDYEVVLSVSDAFSTVLSKPVRIHVNNAPIIVDDAVNIVVADLGGGIARLQINDLMSVPAVSDIELDQVSCVINWGDSQVNPVNSDIVEKLPGDCLDHFSPMLNLTHKYNNWTAGDKVKIKVTVRDSGPGKPSTSYTAAELTLN